MHHRKRWICALICAAALFAATGAIAAPAKKLSISAAAPFVKSAAAASSVSVRAFADEIEPFMISVKSPKELKAVRVVAAADFKGAGKNVIPRDSIMVRKIDGEYLVGDRAASGVVYADSDLGAAPTQFWVSVSVPKKTAPGVYKGAISFSYQNRAYETLPVVVNVLPFVLPGSSKQYALFTSYAPGDSQEEQAAWSDFLSITRDMGMRVVSVNYAANQCEAEFLSYRDAGMTGPLPLLYYADPQKMPTFEEMMCYESARKKAGIPMLLFFVVDNPTTPEQIALAKQQLEGMKGTRSIKVARVSTEQAVAELEPSLDGISYYIGMPYIQDRISGAQKRTSNKWEWYWWDLRTTSVDNRLYAGLKLWKSGLDGAMPVWEPIEGQRITDGGWSLRGEALREGIDDTRYLTLFMRVLRELKDLKNPHDKEYIQAKEAWINAFLAKDMDKLAPQDLSAFRTKIADEIMSLIARAKRK